MIDLKTRFSNAIRKNRLAHAFLFLGESEELKEQTALELAAGLFCEQKIIPDGCGLCISCKQVFEKRNPRLRFLTAEAGSEIKIDQIRDLTSSSGNPSWIIFNAHRMSKQASNALLKTLEEPRSDQFFILIAPNTRSLLPTLVSRCQRVFFPSSPSPLAGEGRGEGAIPATLLERMTLIETLIKEKADLPALLANWFRNSRDETEFKEALFKAQEDLGKHVNPQLILEALLLSKKA